MPSNPIPADFARQLERELIAVTEQRDEALEYADKLAQGLPDGMLPKDVEVLREANCGLAMELTAVTEQRDKIDSMYHKIIKEVLECDPIPACKRKDDQLEPPWEVIARVREQRDVASQCHKWCYEDRKRITEELTAVTKQRDRLADALRKFVILTERMAIGIEVGNDLIVAWDIADEALQSLTTKEL